MLWRKDLLQSFYSFNATTIAYGINTPYPVKYTPLRVDIGSQLAVVGNAGWFHLQVTN